MDVFYCTCTQTLFFTLDKDKNKDKDSYLCILHITYEDNRAGVTVVFKHFPLTVDGSSRVPKYRSGEE